jgi:hypothetical protein
MDAQQLHNIQRQNNENILKTNNTAQETLISILDQSDKNAKELVINQSISGNVDFSILEERGFKNIRFIHFLNEGPAYGQIRSTQRFENNLTGISNLPDKLEKLYCYNQRLMDLENLPPTLVELDCQNNHISSLDLSRLKKLKVLKVSTNWIEELENLPDSLEELYCDNNRIKKINLRHLLHLRTLHISNNKTVIIENLPPSVVDFKSENNPYLEIRHTSLHENIPDFSEETIDRRIDYNDSIHDYFKLKHKYDEEVYKARKKAFTKGKEKKLSTKSSIKLARRVEPKCIHCKRPGGTIFKTANNTYYAYCGNKNPCNLKIQIYNGTYYNQDDSLFLEHAELHDLKTKVIQQKLDTLFNYISEEKSVKKFKEYLEEFTFYQADYTELIEKNNHLYKEEGREEKIRRKTQQVYELMGSIREIVEQYKKEGDPNVLQMAVQLQVRELNPEIENLRRLKYEVMEVDMNMGGAVPAAADDDAEGTQPNPVTTVSTLVQKYAAIHKMQNPIGKPPQVVKYAP